jgi:NADH:ubiquinone oxidoreductase subunit 3 (subunit A)
MKIFVILGVITFILFELSFAIKWELGTIYFGVMYLSVLIAAVGHQTDSNRK